MKGQGEEREKQVSDEDGEDVNGEDEEDVTGEDIIGEDKEGCNNQKMKQNGIQVHQLNREGLEWVWTSSTKGASKYTTDFSVHALGKSVCIPSPRTLGAEMLSETH